MVMEFWKKRMLENIRREGAEVAKKKEIYRNKRERVELVCNSPSKCKEDEMDIN